MSTSDLPPHPHPTRHTAAHRPRHTNPDHPIDPRENALVNLLAQGHTDATAARELHISTRSVSNIFRSLMDKLGVENRFQLCLALGAMHAVTPRAAQTHDT